MLMTGMLADDITARIDKLATLHRLRRAPFDEGGVILVRDKADFLRIGLVVDGKLQLLCDGADGGLFKLADGQERVLHRVASHAEENIGLVLAMIDAAEKRF